MYNEKYSYENMKLWDSEIWKDRISPVCELAHWIEAKNHELFRTKAGVGPYTGRTDGRYDSKSVSYFYDDIIDGWAEKGLIYMCTEQARVCWMAMLPKAVYERKDHDANVLIVLHDADYSDPNWAAHTLKEYEAYNEKAARDGDVIIYVCPDGVNYGNNHIGITQEVSVIYNLAMNNVYLDVSTVVKTGSKLSEIEGFYYTDNEGNKVSDPDAYIEKFGDIPVLNITRRWQNTASHQQASMFSDWVQDVTYDVNKHIHSESGKKMAEGMRIEYDFKSGKDPKFAQYWADMGLRYESHDYNGYQWLSYVPEAYLGQNENKLPVMLIFAESTYQDDYQPVSGAASFKGFLDIAATGEMICLFFAMENPDDNDMFYGILQDAAKIYPIDLSRVYVTGHSHNGHFAGEFVRRHHDAIAAFAPLGNHLGMPAPEYTRELVVVTDDKIELTRTFDMPTVVISGIAENLKPMHILDDRATLVNADDAYRRRLRAYHCPDKTVEEIHEAREHGNYVTRQIGFPVDKTSLEFLMGCEIYIGDITNEFGKDHLRFVIIENQPHIASPQMGKLAWDYVRRFKRDLETGEVIELY